MFRVERKEYFWEGNYWNPTKAWHDWEDAGLPLLANQEEACKLAQKKAQNPFTIGFRVVNLKDGKVVQEFNYERK